MGKSGGETLPSMIMATRIAENKNGNNGGQTAVTKTDLAKTVSELETSHGTKLVDARVRVEFKVAARQAKMVSVAGTFNGWDPQKNPLKKNGDAWKTAIALPRGRYEYRLVVDGEWLADPSARESVANPFGSCNSVLTI
jgi:1,4-alpha-glucan branching enzyme